MNDNRAALESFFRSRSSSAIAIKDRLFRRWISQSLSAHGVEFVFPDLSNQVVASDLNVVSIKSTTLPAFIIVALEGRNVEGLGETFAAISGLSLGSRICIAADHKTLRLLEETEIDKSRIGYLLDKVNADTPLSYIADDLVEAVRFDPAFALHAVTDLRSRCVLAAMLALTRDLSLPTLGPAMPTCEESPALAFDYFPEALG